MLSMSHFSHSRSRVIKQAHAFACMAPGFSLHMGHGASRYSSKSSPALIYHNILDIFGGYLYNNLLVGAFY